jgi:hypothetical protein
MNPTVAGGHLCTLPVIIIGTSQINIELVVGISASAGHEDIVRYLVGADANVNATNDKGLTPL